MKIKRNVKSNIHQQTNTNTMKQIKKKHQTTKMNMGETK